MKNNIREKIISAWLSNAPILLATPRNLKIEISNSLPVFGFALHAGHNIRDDLVPKLNLNRKQMLKEEDPRTEKLIESLPNQIYPLHSRFECDLNRPKIGRPVEDAIYTEPSLAWNLKVYRVPLTQEEIDFSLEAYKEFYWLVDTICQSIEERYSFGIFIDMHSYNIRGRKDLPDIHLGTKYQSREKFSYEISCLLGYLKQIKIKGGPLDVIENDENVGFFGGKLNRFVAQKFKKILVISLEMKKFFMDEEEGIFYEDIFSEFKNQINDVFSLMISDMRRRDKFNRI